MQTKAAENSTSPQFSTVVDFAADSLVLPQTAEEADLRGEHLVVGNLVHQLFTWEQHEDFMFSLCEWKAINIFSKGKMRTEMKQEIIHRLCFFF